MGFITNLFKSKKQKEKEQRLQEAKDRSSQRVQSRISESSSRHNGYTDDTATFMALNSSSKDSYSAPDTLYSKISDDVCSSISSSSSYNSSSNYSSSCSSSSYDSGSSYSSSSSSDSSSSYSSD